MGSKPLRYYFQNSWVVEIFDTTLEGDADRGCHPEVNYHNALMHKLMIPKGK